MPEGQRIDSEDALAAVGRLIEAEHKGDAAEREVTAIILRGQFDLKTALSVLELARAVERATDQLAGFGHLLRGARPGRSVDMTGRAIMHIVRIGDGSAAHHAPDVVGAKASNLARVAALGLPVPPAFVLPIKLCAAIVGGDHHAKQALSDGLRDGIEFLESATGKRFGDRRRPLLVSVRSGAARSMPGMLDTVLDVGCTLAAVHGLVRMTGHPRFAWDCRRRFLESYASVVMGVAPASFAQRTCRLGRRRRRR